MVAPAGGQRSGAREGIARFILGGGGWGLGSGINRSGHLADVYVFMG